MLAPLQLLPFPGEEGEARGGRAVAGVLPGSVSPRVWWDHAFTPESGKVGRWAHARSGLWVPLSGQPPRISWTRGLHTKWPQFPRGAPVTSIRTCDSPEKPAAWGSPAGVLTVGKRRFHGGGRLKADVCLVKLRHPLSPFSADVLLPEIGKSLQPLGFPTVRGLAALDPKSL